LTAGALEIEHAGLRQKSLNNVVTIGVSGPKMMSEKDYNTIDELATFLLDVIMISRPPSFPVYLSSVDSFKTLYANLISTRDFLYSASNGDLSKQVPFKGFVAGTLKTLQANLRHMTWQTKMIASGDFSQRVEFMGEFSQSFNAMVMQLDQTLKELVDQKKKLSKVNEDLAKEIAIRKKTELALRQSQEILEQQLITDSLTGLYNRRHFNKLAEEEIDRSFRYLQPLSIIMFDIDFFKHVNDKFGHVIGDNVLKMIAFITKNQIRTTDIAARYGGEEFIVLLPETSLEDAVILAERLKRQIEKSVIQIEEQPLSVTASFGVSNYLIKTNEKPRDKILLDFIDNADKALYTSKKNGRNKVSTFSPEQKSLKFKLITRK
jgi:diguanylate cyclase (GGDEF)-like protein